MHSGKQYMEGTQVITPNLSQDSCWVLTGLGEKRRKGSQCPFRRGARNFLEYKSGPGISDGLHIHALGFQVTLGFGTCLGTTFMLLSMKTGNW